MQYAALEEFAKTLNNRVESVQDADVHIVYVEKGSEVTEDFVWIKSNAAKVVAVVENNKFRRFAPKDFIWQDCVSLRSKKDAEQLLAKLNAEEWNGFPTKEEKRKELDERRAAKAEKRAEKDRRRAENAVAKVLEIGLRGDGLTLEVPEGAKNITLKLLAEWN